MKKSVCLMAILGAFCASVNAATSEGVPVDFFGKVEAATCNVTVGQTGNKINLGRVSPDANSEGVLVPVTFAFTNCTTTGITSIKLESGQNGSEDNVAGGVLGTTKTGVTIKLFNDRAGTAYQQTVTYDPDSDGKVDGNKTVKVTPFYARLAVGGANAATGEVDSSALFMVEYK